MTDATIAAGDARLYGLAIAIVIAIAAVMTVWASLDHAARRRAARTIHPAIRVAIPCHACHQAPGIHTRILATNYTAIRVCDKCDHAGEKTGRWIDLTRESA